MSSVSHNIFIDYLDALGVDHTKEYSTGRFETMPFKSLFGFTRLLKEYGVESEGYEIADRKEMALLPVPWLADTAKGFVIVRNFTPEKVVYESEGEILTTTPDNFLSASTGFVMLAMKGADAKEPDYAAHHRAELIAKGKRVVLTAAVLLVALWLFVSNGLGNHLSTVLITLVDLLGLALTYMLVQKSMGIHSKAAGKVCGVLDKEGCDTVLSTKASSFLGIVNWSEVGFAYFGVSLLCLLIFPGAIHLLAVCNLCCLPFTVWSIWYQKFRIKTWCTLCVSVQATLWLLFFCYWGGGWLFPIWPVSASIILLGAAYLIVLLTLNALIPNLKYKKK